MVRPWFDSSRWENIREFRGEEAWHDIIYVWKDHFGCCPESSRELARQEQESQVGDCCCRMRRWLASLRVEGIAVGPVLVMIIKRAGGSDHWGRYCVRVRHRWQTVLRSSVLIKGKSGAVIHCDGGDMGRRGLGMGNQEFPFGCCRLHVLGAQHVALLLLRKADQDSEACLPLQCHLISCISLHLHCSFTPVFTTCSCLPYVLLPKCSVGSLNMRALCVSLAWAPCPVHRSPQ